MLDQRAAQAAVDLADVELLALRRPQAHLQFIAARANGQGADEFLGTQGDQWDTQSDMFLALVGATVALATLSRVHDRQLRALGTSPAIGLAAAKE